MYKKKILIVTYYWPPSGGAGVQRWLKFSKYLPEYGYEPHVVVPENPNYPSLDSSLENDLNEDIKIIKFPIWEPYNIYRKFMGFSNDYKINHTFSSNGKSSSWKSKCSLWIKSNLFIPDPRIFWIFNTVPKLKKYIVEHEIDTIITTSPPHSMQLIGYLLKRKLPQLKWIADFRDPWSTIYYMDSLPISKFSKKINAKLEKKVLKKADKVITVSPSLAKELELIRGKKVEVITNGYDEIDFKDLSHEFQYDFFNLVYIGTLYNEYNMPNLWEVLSELAFSNDEFKTKLKLTIAGSISEELIENFIKLKLEDNLEFKGYVNHSEICNIMNDASILLLTTPKKNNAGILTGKVFEYLATLKPIFCITSPNNDLWNLISDSKSGIAIDFNNKESIKNSILDLFSDFKNQNIKLNDKSNILKYTRKELTKSLTEFI